MNGYAAVANLGRSVMEFLQTGLDKVFLGDNGVEATLESPKKIQDESKTEHRILSVNIYRIAENADLLNAPARPRGESGSIGSIGLDVHFSVIPYGPDTETALLILGLAQRILHSTVIAGSLFKSSDQTDEGHGQSVKITQEPLAQDAITHMWQAMECPMRPALYYLATPLLIDFEERHVGKPVAERLVGAGDGGEKT